MCEVQLTRGRMANRSDQNVLEAINKNSSADEIANMNLVRRYRTRI